MVIHHRWGDEGSLSQMGTKTDTGAAAAALDVQLTLNSSVCTVAAPWVSRKSRTSAHNTWTASSTERGKVTQTLRPAASKASTTWRVFSSWLASTNSGLRSMTACGSTDFVPPTTARRLSSVAGGRQNSVTPTTASPAPRSNKLSVIDGTRLTTRCGAWVNDRSEVWPLPPVTLQPILSRG